VFFVKYINAEKYPLWFLYLAMLFQQLVTALAYPLAKLGLNQIDPYTYAFYRFLFTSIIYIPVLLWFWNRPRIPLKDHVRIFFIGVILIVLNQVIYLVGQSLTAAGHSALLFATVPIFIYILAIFTLGEKGTFRRTSGIIIAFIGVVIILTGGKVNFGMEYFWGDILILCAVISWAFATVLLKPLALKYGAFRSMGLGLVYGSLVYFPYGVYRAITADYTSLKLSGWLTIVYMAVFISLGAYFIWYWAIKYMDVSRVAVLQNIQPVLATAIAAWMLAEPISTTFVIGGIVAISGVILTEIK